MALNTTTTTTKVQTTLPCLTLAPNTSRRLIQTINLTLRPLQQSDLHALHALRTDPEAMTGTTLGRIDQNLSETQAALDFFVQESQSHFLYGVFLNSTGELIGEGGVHTLDSPCSGWPEIGYKFRKEYWGRGFATEFLRALLRAWWGLPRQRVSVRVSCLTVGGIGKSEGGEMVEEQELVYANVDVGNVGSQRVLEKIGFQRFVEWTEPDTQVHRLGEPVTLVGFKLACPSVDCMSSKESDMK